MSLRPPSPDLSKSRSREFTDLVTGAILFDPRMLSVLTADMVEEYVPRWINAAHLPTRLQARRAILMFMNGRGECSLGLDGCRGRIVDYHRISGYYEFDHIDEIETTPVSARSNMRQFRISGSDCTRRTFAKVVSHCLADTRVVCTPCHIKRTEGSRWRRAHAH